MKVEELGQMLKDWNDKRPVIACIFLGEPTPEVVITGRIQHADRSGVTVQNQRARFYLGVKESKNPKVLDPDNIPAPIRKYARNWVRGLETSVGDSEIFLLEFPNDVKDMPLSTLESPST